MVNINTSSLAETIDAVNDAFFYQRIPPHPERQQVARWIAELRGKPGAYADMFAPTITDRSQGIKVFTGEAVKSNAAIGHILGEEACRALILLDVADAVVKEALDRATRGMLRRLGQNETAGRVHGIYCCGTCSAAYWRHVAVGGLDRNEERLVAGMQALKSHRAGNNRWRRFPFYYTLLALSEMDLKPAREEMRYAAPALERYLRGPERESRFAARRRVIAESVLSRCL